MSERKYNAFFKNGFRNEVGELDPNIPSRAGGKKLLEWTFRVKGTDEVVPVTVHFERGVDGMQFVAHCSKLTQAIKDADINRLHLLVEAQLIDQCYSISHIAWEDWFEVIVKGENSDFADSKYSALGANLHIQVNRLKRGVHPTSGEVVTINSNGLVVPFPKSTELSDGPTEMHSIRIQDASGRSYIPATSANEYALRNVLLRMDMLRVILANVLSQEKVSESLVNLDRTIPLLGNGPNKND